MEYQATSRKRNRAALEEDSPDSAAEVMASIEPARKSTRIRCPDGADLPFISSLGSDMVDIFVGPQKQLFRIHKQTLCNKIPYFEKMFNGGFKEAAESCASLPEGSTESFDVLIEWVYRSRLRDLQRQDHKWNYGPFQFYILAERLCITELLNDFMDMFRKGYADNHLVPDDEKIILSYSNCHVRSPLRKFGVHMLYYKYTSNKSTRQTSKLHELLKRNDDLMRDYLDIARSQSLAVKMLDPSRAPNNDYHIPQEDDNLSQQQ